MQFFVYCRDTANTAGRRVSLAESHWSFMDRYADAMIARGPTLTEDRTAATGSMHIVDLSDHDAARSFAFDEPNYRAGVYADVFLRRWQNTLGRTMWEFAGDAAGDERFLIIGHGRPGASEARAALVGAHRRYLRERGYLDRLIACGPLLSDDGTQWLGSALLAELRDRAAAEGMVGGSPYADAGLYGRVEIHPWEFGGRR